MTERDYMKKFADVLNSVPGCVCRILPDTGGKTHKKPYDAFIIYKGIHISIEGKMGGGKLEEHQKKALREDREAGGASYVVRFCAHHFSIFPCIPEESVNCRFSDSWEFFTTKKDVLNMLNRLCEVQ